MGESWPHGRSPSIGAASPRGYGFTRTEQLTAARIEDRALPTVLTHGHGHAIQSAALVSGDGHVGSVSRKVTEIQRIESSTSLVVTSKAVRENRTGGHER